MWTRWFMAAVGLAILGAGTPARPEVPEVSVRGKLPVGIGQFTGISKPFWGTSEGERWLFKSNRPVRATFGLQKVMASGNLEAEWLTSRLMQDAGIPTPRVDVVRIQGRQHAHARIQPMQSMFPGRPLAKGLGGLPRDARIDMAALRRLQLMDLMVGNADRHIQNIWFVQEAAGGAWKPIAFDHNLAMGTRAALGGPPSNFTAFENVTHRTTASGVTVPTWATSDVVGRNPAYAGALRDPQGVLEYLGEARSLQQRLPEARLRELVGAIPDEAIAGSDKAARRQEILDHLLRRRAGLPQAMDFYVRQHPEYLRTEFRLAELPPEVQAKLPPDLEGRWRFVGTLGPDGRFDPTRFQAALAGAAGAAAAAPRNHTLRQLQAMPRTTGRGIPSYDFLEVAETPEGRKLSGVAGHPVPPPEAPVHRVAAKAGAALQPGERLHVEKAGGWLGGYEARILDPDGTPVHRARYHTVGTTAVRTAGPAPTARVLVTPTSSGPSTRSRYRPRLRVRIRGM